MRFTQNQWRVGAYTASTAAGGFQKWTEIDTLALPRPTYPTFGNNLDINVATQIFPNPNYSLVDCSLYADAGTVTKVNTSVTGFYVNGFCTSSCYTPISRSCSRTAPRRSSTRRTRSAPG